MESGITQKNNLTGRSLQPIRESPGRSCKDMKRPPQRETAFSDYRFNWLSKPDIKSAGVSVVFPIESILRGTVAVGHRLVVAVVTERDGSALVPRRDHVVNNPCHRAEIARLFLHYRLVDLGIKFFAVAIHAPRHQVVVPAGASKTVDGE